METELLNIIIKVLKDEASPLDKQKLIAWLAEDEANMQVFKQSESVWNAFEILKMGKEYNSERAFDLFREKVSNRLKSSRRNGLYKKIDVLIRIAAVFVILIGIGYLFILPKEKSILSDQSLVEIISPRGSKTQVLLPDGTKIWINSGSKIQYSNNFNQSTREVFLEGEGYFEVKKNPEKPFIVATSDIRIKALGTTFNIKAYPEDKTIETTLIEGNLDVVSGTSGKSTKLASLKPNQKVTYYKEKETIHEQQKSEGKIESGKDRASALASDKVVSNEKVNPSQITSWKNDAIYFENEKFMDLAIKLERRFGVSLHFVDEDLKQVCFTGKFPDIIIEQVFQALQFASPFYYEFKDKDIYLSKKPIEESALKNFKTN